MPKSSNVNTTGDTQVPVAILDLRSPTFSRDFRKAAKAFTARATASPEAARAQLIQEGILTPSGKLAKNYR